jgi:hypothetical protein
MNEAFNQHVVIDPPIVLDSARFARDTRDAIPEADFVIWAVSATPHYTMEVLRAARKHRPLNRQVAEMVEEYRALATGPTEGEGSTISPHGREKLAAILREYREVHAANLISVRLPDGYFWLVYYRCLPDGGRTITVVPLPVSLGDASTGNA